MQAIKIHAKRDHEFVEKKAGMGELEGRDGKGIMLALHYNVKTKKVFIQNFTNKNISLLEY